MPTIQTNITVEPGDATNANEINTNNNNIATATQLLDDENTNNEWCSRHHVNFSAISLTDSRVFNSNILMDSGVTQQTVNWNAYQVINLGTDFRHSEINPGDFTLQPGEVIRLHLDINVADITTVVSGSSVGTGAGDDTYAFRFYYSTDGGNNYLAFNCESRYSYTILPRDAVPAPYGPIVITNAAPYERHRQRCNHTLCFINTGNSAIAYTNIEARVKIENLAWITSLEIDDGTFTMMIARN